MAELQKVKDEARLKQKLVPDERRALKERLRQLDDEALRGEVDRLESLAQHQAYKAASSDDVAKHGLLQRRQDELAVAREVLLARSADADDDKLGAALRIQCFIRRFLAGVEARRRRNNREEGLKDRLEVHQKDESALLIQGQMRRILARKELDRRKERKVQGLDPTREGDEPDRRPAAAYRHPHPDDLMTPAPPSEGGEEEVVAEDNYTGRSDAGSPMSGTRSLPLHPSHQALLPAYSIQDVSDVPITDDELKEQFEKIDQNGNGWIDKGEFVQFYRELESYGVEETEEELAEILARYNMLGDNRLSFDEFAIIMLKLAQR
eukprot:Hpha_TRINITY_DN16822_c0_g22::TRINITY_DN16822_c0_g22_i1::g.149854::m.149854